MEEMVASKDITFYLEEEIKEISDQLHSVKSSVLSIQLAMGDHIGVFNQEVFRGSLYLSFQKWMGICIRHRAGLVHLDCARSLG